MGHTFITEMLKNPRQIGAVWPSGPALAAGMVVAADLRPGDRVVEVGAGTGVFTRLLARHPGPFFAVEPSAPLARLAREAAPNVEVVEAWAQDLPELVRARGWTGVDRVVSGLPFAIWPDLRQEEVLDAIGRVLVPGGRLVTFTYAHAPWFPAGRRFARRLRGWAPEVSLGPVIWANVSPARIYVARRPSD